MGECKGNFEGFVMGNEQQNLSQLIHPLSAVRKSDKIVVPRMVRGRGRPRLTWEYVVQQDMNIYNLNEHIALDCADWRKRIHTADPN